MLNESQGQQLASNLGIPGNGRLSYHGCSVA